MLVNIAVNHNQRFPCEIFSLNGHERRPPQDSELAESIRTEISLAFNLSVLFCIFRVSLFNENFSLKKIALQEFNSALSAGPTESLEQTPLRQPM